MINGSTAFNNAVESGGYPYIARISKNGTVVDCDILNCTIYKGATGEEEFTVGVVFVPYIELEITGLTINLENSELMLEVGVQISSTETEWITIGYYTVAKISTSTVKTTLTAVGRISALLPTITPSVLTAPVTVASVLSDIQTAVRNEGYSAFTINYDSVDVTGGAITKNLLRLNCRDLLTVVTGLIGGYATEDNAGNVVIFKYDTTTPIAFNGDKMIVHPAMNNNAFTLDDIKVVYLDGYESDDGTYVDEQSYSSGDSPKLTLKDEYMTTELLFNKFCTNCLGLEYQPGVISLADGDPRLEASDVLEITDTNSAVYIMPCFNVVHTLIGSITSTITTPGQTDTEAGAVVVGPITQQVKQLASDSKQTKDRLVTAETSITQTATSIESLASNQSTYTKPDGTTGTNAIASAISQNASDITLKVSKNDVINQINVSTEGATIHATKVNIEGATIFTSGRLSSTSLDNAYDAKGSASDAFDDAKDYVDGKGYQTAGDVASAVATGVSGKADKTDAVARQQRIYYRKTSSGAPSKNTTWLSTSGTGYGNWSLSIPQMTSGTTKYPYLYTAIQTQTVSQMSGTTCSCSDVLLDETTTVIDGGTIITGTVNANAVNASSGTFDVANIPNLSASKITSGTIAVGVLPDDALNSNLIDTNTASGAVAHFEDASAYPAIDVTANIEPIQAGSGTPSPSNVRAISGWTSIHAYRAGKNVLNLSGITPAKTEYGVTFTVNADGTTTASGTATAQCQIVWRMPNATAKRFAGMMFRGFESLPTGVLCRLEERGGGYALYANNNTVISNAIATNTNDVNVIFRIASGTTVSNLVFRPQIEYGSTATAYEQYNGETATVSLGQTVYGGTLDVTSGLLTIDRAIVDLGSLSWTYNNTSYSYGFFNSSALSDRKVGRLTNAVCSCYAVNQGDRSGMGSADAQIVSYNTTNANAVCVRDDRYTDATAFKTAVTGQKLVYELATPTTVQLTPTQINLLQGTNNVWSDSGNISVEYATMNSDMLALAGTIPEAAKTATSYITYINPTDGIKVHSANDTTNYAQINSSGMDVVKGGTSVAFYGDTARIGKANDFHTVISDRGISLTDNYGVGAFEIVANGSSETQTRTLSYLMKGPSDTKYAYFTAPLDKTAITFTITRYLIYSPTATPTTASITIPASDFAHSTGTYITYWTGTPCYKWTIGEATLYRYSDTGFWSEIEDSDDTHADYMSLSYSATAYPISLRNSNGNTLLWSGAWFMNGEQVAFLNESISSQLSGIVLAWSAWANSAAQNYDWKFTFIPKGHALLQAGTEIECGPFATPLFGKVGNKYIGVYDDRLVGNNYNTSTTSTATASGIKYTNNYWVLRYVFGV